MRINPAGIARIHRAPDGRWYATPDSMDHLVEDGPNFPTRRAVIDWLRRETDTTHYLTPAGRVRPLHARKGV